MSTNEPNKTTAVKTLQKISASLLLKRLHAVPPNSGSYALRLNQCSESDGPESLPASEHIEVSFVGWVYTFTLHLARHSSKKEQKNRKTM